MEDTRITGMVFTVALEGLVFDVLLDAGFIGRPVGWYVGIHSHGEFEVHYVTDGKGKIYLGGEIIPVHADTLCLVRPKVYHRQMKEDGDSLEKLCLRFSVREEKINARYAALENKQEILHILNDAETSCALFAAGTGEVLQDIRRELQKRDMAFYSQVQAKLVQLLVLTFRALYHERDDRGFLPETLVRDRRVQIMDTFFALEYASDAAPADLAGKLNVSESQLNRILKKVYGCTFKQKMTFCRIEAAKYLLEQTSYTGEKISEIVGYANPGNFQQAFKKKTGMTPYEYRKSSLR